MQFTVMTFNLRYPEPKDGPDCWPNRVGIAAEAIVRHDPLVVGTQEGYYTMLKDLEPGLPGYTWIGTGRRGGQEDEHCAIFYKETELELTRQRQFWLSETPEIPALKSWDSDLPRICCWGQFTHKSSGKTFVVMNTHLDHLGQEARNRGSKMIWEEIVRLRSESVDPLPVILMGDFNSRPEEPPIRFFRGESDLYGTTARLNDAYSILSGEPGLTAHSFKGGSDGGPIDYIFSTDELQFLDVLVERGDFGGKYPSDHYPVVSRIEHNS